MLGRNQTTLSVPLEVTPESSSRLSALVEALRIREDLGEFGIPENFARISREVPALHFMSMSVFSSANYDPMFILEANFDGPAGVFWGQLEAALGPDLRDILRCCKRPLDDDGPLYDSVTAPESRAPIAPYLEARTQWPSVFHHGNRGLNRDRILAEAALFGAVRTALDADDGPATYRRLSPEGVHGFLRHAMLDTYPWLDQPPPARVPVAERMTDILRLLLFAVATVFVLTLPGFLLALLLPWTVYVPVVIGFGGLLMLVLYLLRKPLPGEDVPTDFDIVGLLWRNAGLIAVYVAVSLVLLVPVFLLGSYLLALFGFREPLGLWPALELIAPALFLGLLSLVVTGQILVVWLRFLERRDSSQDAPQINEQTLSEMVQREDWIAQNHMGSIVLIKPGVLRTIIIRAGHLGLGLLLRVKATDGYLGSMRTVHFAHWAFLNNGSRLLFVSNFDHSWDSYLDDFIEKAHVGLTLAWGCGVGFPPSRFLIYDGASHGRRFKNWALASRTVSRFWYSAYPTLTVDQIERNNRIASGLCRKALTEEEAIAWMRDL